MAGRRTWRAATEAALYGPGGAFLRPAGPAAHFRTSVHASGLFAAAVARLAGRCGLRTVVDVGAGRGELLRALGTLDPGLRLVGVERAARPADLPAGTEWLPVVPPAVGALVVANEWLDAVPVDVVTVTPDGPRLLLVDPATGAEAVGPPPSAADLAWLAAWWPLDAARVGDRAEVGRPRDEAWAAVVAAVDRGVAVAVDYAHRRADRAAGRLAGGTLTGYRAGRQVRPVPDGSGDVTSHVALDACAAAGAAAGATATVLTDQRTALRALGVRAARPPYELARSDPAGYLRRLQAAGEAGELTARGGLGDFGWLVQGVGVALPPIGGQATVTGSDSSPRMT